MRKALGVTPVTGLKGMILTAEQTDLQKLELYLDQHYMEKLSLASVSQELSQRPDRPGAAFCRTGA